MTRWFRGGAIGLFGVACLLGLVFLLPSCEQEQQASDRKSVIRFWHFWSEPTQKTAIRSLIAEFEQQTGATVELTELSWNDGKAKLQAAFNSGSPPDVVELGSDWVAQFSSAGVLLPLPADSASVSPFVAYSVQPGMWNGRLYAYPWTVDTRVLWVNKGLVQASGWKGELATLADLLRASEKVREHGAFGFGANGADAHRLYKKVLPFIWTMGGDIVNANGQPTLNTSENVKALELYAELARTGFIETQRQLDAAFIQGKVAFWISGSWMINKINKASNLDAEAVLIPGASKGTGVSFAGGEYLAVSAATKNTQRARELVQFLCNGANAIKLCTMVPEAGFPADKQAALDPKLVTDPYKSVFAQQLSHARMTPVHKQWLDLEELFEDAVVHVLLGESTAQESLDAAQSDAEALVNR